MAYLRVLNQPADDLAFERIVNLPKRGIGAATLQAVHRLARAQDTAMLRAAGQLVETDELTARARTALGRLIADFARWRGLAETTPHPELAEIVLDESGYTEMWQRDKAPDAPGRLENLKELVAAMAEFENLAGFLEHVSLVMDNIDAAAGDMISLMTLHAAKGLEFDTIFLPGWEEGLFPHQRALDEGGTAALEEERRLAYVGLTRARRRIHVSHAANRRVHNQWLSAIPSRFVGELPAENIEVVSDLSATTPGDGFAEPKSGFRGFQWGRQDNSRLDRGRVRRDGVVIDDEAEFLSTAAEGKFAIGARVFHTKFGYGKVTAVDGDKLAVDFDHSGVKKVIDSFVQPA
jgi:DNA helicase-2/ATP-dependent DNA helicase PcrA